MTLNELIQKLQESGVSGDTKILIPNYNEGFKEITKVEPDTAYPDYYHGFGGFGPYCIGLECYDDNDDGSSIEVIVIK